MDIKLHPFDLSYDQISLHRVSHSTNNFNVGYDLQNI